MDRLVDIVADQMTISRDQINTSTRLVDDLGADSLDMTELLVEVEDEFGLSIEDEEIEGKNTIGEWAELILKKKVA